MENNQQQYNFEHNLLLQLQHQQQQQQWQLQQMQQEQLQQMQQEQQRQLQQVHQQQQLFQRGVLTKRRKYSLSDWPVGYRFDPLDHELIEFYLGPKITKSCPVPAIGIQTVNLYDYSPDQLTRKYPKDNRLFRQKEWYFFTSRNRKYANGKRPDRRAGEGYWRPNGGGKKEVQYGDGSIIGYKDGLDYYHGNPGDKDKIKTNWKMHEYRIERWGSAPNRMANGEMNMQLDEFVLCRVYLSTRGKNNDEGHGDEEENEAEDSSTNTYDYSGQAVHTQHEPVVQNQNNNLISLAPNITPDAYVWPQAYEFSNGNFETFDHRGSYHLNNDNFHMFDQNGYSFDGFNSNMYQTMANFPPTTSTSHVEPSFRGNMLSTMVNFPPTTFAPDVGTGFNTNMFGATADLPLTTSVAQVEPSFTSYYNMLVEPGFNTYYNMLMEPDFDSYMFTTTANTPPYTTSIAHIEPGFSSNMLSTKENISSTTSTAHMEPSFNGNMLQTVENFPSPAPEAHHVEPTYSILPSSNSDNDWAYITPPG